MSVLDSITMVTGPAASSGMTTDEDTATDGTANDERYSAFVRSRKVTCEPGEVELVVAAMVFDGPVKTIGKRETIPPPDVEAVVI